MVVTVLERLRLGCTKVLGRTVTDAVITVPGEGWRATWLGP